MVHKTLQRIHVLNIEKQEPDVYPEVNSDACKRNKFLHWRYLLCNKNVDIKFSAHDAFLEWPSSSTLNIEILESQII